MQFSSTLYPYQSEILEVFEKERKRGDKKIHIVAPPGSGKTIVGLEMMTRLDVPTLILVPNLTLQEQWKDKLEKLFLEAHESSDKLISTDIDEIKKINIVTYQSLSGSDTPDASVESKILDLWYESEKSEFEDKETFLSFVSSLKIENPDEYRELYGKNRKKLKESGDSEYTRKLMKSSIHDYVDRLRSMGVQAMIVDEAHHLTAWWSHVLHAIWVDLGHPYIIGLTATPPFESADYFELDESYTELLGTVDYYVPTPAIVKSGRLAPYSDLVYIVEPGNELSSILSTKEKILQDFIEIHKDEITTFLHEFLKENFTRLETKSLDLLEKWMRFIYVYKSGSLDMSSYITANARKSLTLEDIAKSIGKWGADGFKKSKNEKLLSEIKGLFFDLGYIWRGANLYRFQTPIEKGLIYSKSKINGAQSILDQEIQNLGDDLRCAIITDFLDVESDWINGHYIFDELSKTHSKLNPYLVSGQGIWKLEKGAKTLVDESILSVTEKLSTGETRLVIGTRGILGEGWDCPRVNTLIDLTGVSAYMSVNQVHGRAIRLDTKHPEKVANIYDIVCLGEGYQGMRDFERLEKKHSQFYGVDDSGLIIKELDHIYPQLEKNIADTKKINTYTLKKSGLRSMVKELWGIGGEYKNEEIFSLSIEILKPYEVVPLPSRLSWWQLRKIKPENWKNENLMELGKSTYHQLVRTWIREMLDATLQVMKPYDMIPGDFSYDMKWSPSGSITITSDYVDPLVSKRFIETISGIFGPITSEKYLFLGDRGSSVIQNKERRIKYLGTMSGVLLLMLAGGGLSSLNLLLDATHLEDGIILLSCIICTWFTIYLLRYCNIRQLHAIKGFMSFALTNYSFGIPDIIASNEEKRRYFIGRSYGGLSEKANWYTKITTFIWQYIGHIGSLHILSFTILLIIFIFLWFFSIITVFPSTVTTHISPILTLLLMLFILSPFYGLILFIIHLPYLLYVMCQNFIKRRKAIQLDGEITPVSQSDIGKPSFLSAKIEKLWI